MILGKRSDVLANETTLNRFVLAFIVLQLIGAGGLLLILLTALFSKSIRRHSTWYSFIASWIFSSICYCLLFFGGQQTGDLPNSTLCTLQAALIYAAPVLTSCTTLSLVTHMYLNFRSLLYTPDLDVRPITALMLLGVPYLVWGVMFGGILIFASQFPETVQRTPKGTYCDCNLPALSRISSCLVLMATVVIISLLSILGFRIIQQRAHIMKLGRTFAMLFRVIAFSIIGILTLGTAVSFVMGNDSDGTFDMLLASFPVLATLIFGSQPDLIRVWLCLRGGYVPANTKSIDNDSDDYSLIGSAVYAESVEAGINNNR